VRALALCLVLLPSLARAYDFQIDAETIGQVYELRAANAAGVDRRRLTQYLGLHVFNLGPRDELGRPLARNQFYLTAAMRMDADMGDYPALVELTGRTPQRELFREKLDLLYAYVGGNDLFGFLDFQAGRQLLIDLFNWASFDGLHLQARTPYHLAGEAWGGVRDAGAWVMDSLVYPLDGTALGQNPYGSLGARQELQPQPTFGVALRSVGLRDLSARVSYERTMSPTGEPRLPGEPGWGVVDERVGLTARGRLFSGRLTPWFAFRYNLLVGRLDEVYAGARTQVGRHGLSVDYVLSAPTFSGDSIWNVFAAQAYDDLRAVYDVAFWRIRAYARAYARLFFDERGATASGGGALGARLDLGSRGWARVDGSYEDGYGGLRAGAEMAANIRILGDPLEGFFAQGRLSYVAFRDDIRPVDRANSFGLQAGLRWTPIHGITLHGIVEENVNRLYPSQLRVLALLDLSFWLGMRPQGIRRPQPWSGF